jgi:hypothetical protein
LILQADRSDQPRCRGVLIVAFCLRVVVFSVLTEAFFILVVASCSLAEAFGVLAPLSWALTATPCDLAVARSDANADRGNLATARDLPRGANRNPIRR